MHFQKSSLPIQRIDTALRYASIERRQWHSSWQCFKLRRREGLLRAPPPKFWRSNEKKCVFNKAKRVSPLRDRWLALQAYLWFFTLLGFLIFNCLRPPRSQVSDMNWIRRKDETTSHWKPTEMMMNIKKRQPNGLFCILSYFLPSSFIS